MPQQGKSSKHVTKISVDLKVQPQEQPLTSTFASRTNSWRPSKQSSLSPAKAERLQSFRRRQKQEVKNERHLNVADVH